MQIDTTNILLINGNNSTITHINDEKTSSICINITILLPDTHPSFLVVSIPITTPKNILQDSR